MLRFLFIFLITFSCLSSMSGNGIDSLDSYRKSLLEKVNSEQAESDLGEWIEAHNLQEYIYENIEEILTECKSVNAKYDLLSVTGSILMRELKFEQSQTLILKGLNLADKNHLQAEKGVLYNTLGNIYGEMKMFSEAFKCFRLSLEIFESKKLFKMQGTVYNNLASLFYNLSHNTTSYLDSAEYYNGIAFQLAKKHDDLNLLRSYYQLNGLIATDRKNNKEAVYALEEALKISEKLQDTISMAYSYYQLGRFYVSQKVSASADKSLMFLENAYNLSIVIEDPELAKEIIYEMAFATKYLGRHKESAELALRYAELNDSLTIVGNEAIIAEMSKKYQSAKQEAEIKDLNLAQKEKQQELNRQRYFLIASVIILIIVVAAAIALYKSNQIRKRVNAQLNEKNNLIESQKREVTAQKDLIETKNKEILDSINYARKIQLTLLANEDVLKNNLRDHFVLFKPKDIVSGDFYWATLKGDKFYMAVCDCTGHGVPGAFMSLLNIGFLNEAINEKNILQPNEIFNYVRQRLIESVSREEQQDGMDGVLLCVDKSNGQITYAAANNAPVLVSNKQLNELPFDKMPVGKGVNENKFNLYGVKLSPQDTLYLYTDGYADQFGGPKGKKFKYKQLNELLVNIHSKNTQQQKENLESAFLDWKKDLEQVDDVCIIGLQV